MDDPIFVDISELEEHPKNKMEEKKFVKFLKDLKKGKTGSVHIEQAIRALPKGDFQDGRKYITTPVTYFYSGIPDSSYSFAFSFMDSDLKYRRPDKPKKAIDDLPRSFYGYMKSYNDSYVRKVWGYCVLEWIKTVALSLLSFPISCLETWSPL